MGSKRFLFWREGQDNFGAGVTWGSPFLLGSPLVIYWGPRGTFGVIGILFGVPGILFGVPRIVFGVPRIVFVIPGGGGL